MTNFNKIFLLFLYFIPQFCGANDRCTNPKEYTIDKRCYVTEEQKQEKPYNAVVSINWYACTGTIVNIDNVPQVFTAKHCTDKDKDGKSDDTLVASLQDGRNIRIYKDDVGDYNFDTHDNNLGDWAKYHMNREINEVPFVHMSSDEGNYHVKLIGYSTLKILSDSDINEFRRLYLDYLDEKIGKDRNTSYKYGYSHFAPAVITKNRYVKQFIEDMSPEQKAKFFKDSKNLKVSDCHYNQGREVDCQTWGGSSGAGIFDDNGVIRGIHTIGIKKIGGKKHALGTGSIKL